MGRCLVQITLLAYSAILARAKFFPFGNGPCPIVEDDNGTEVEGADNRDKCLTDCLVEKTVQPCVAFEFDSELNLCLVFTELGNLSNDSILNVSNSTVECNNKEFVPFFQSKMPLIVLMVQGVFLLHLMYIVKVCADQVSKFQANQNRRKKNASASNVRIVLNREGQVVKESRANASELQVFDRVRGLLRELGGGLQLANPVLFKHHGCVARARDVAEESSDAVRIFLSMEAADLTMISTFKATESLLTDLLNRQPPTGDVEQILMDFCCELAVLFAIFDDEAPADTARALAAAFQETSVEDIFATKPTRMQSILSKMTPRMPMSARSMVTVMGRTPRMPMSARSNVPLPSTPEQPLENSPEPTDSPPVQSRLWSLVFGTATTQTSAEKSPDPPVQQPLEPEQPPAREEPPKPLSQHALLVERADKAKALYKATKKRATLEALEPLQKPQGVSVREKQTILAKAADARDRFGIASIHLLIGVVAVLVALGPVRFLGVPAAVVFFFALVIYAAVDFLRISEAPTFKASVFYFCRATLYIVSGLVMIILLASFGVYNPKNNAELEGRGTFLPVPPQYDLAKIGGQNIYVAIIFGIMHINLMTLILLPLPVAYGLQASFVKWFPFLRFWVPQTPLWLHRTLGYIIIFGLSSVGALWTIFQGAECFTNQTIQACEAFDPETLAGIDVYVLRFHIVWPLGFFFIPLMIYSRYPGPLTGTSKGSNSASSSAPVLLGATSDQGKGKDAASMPKGDQTSGKQGMASDGSGNCRSKFATFMYEFVILSVAWVIVISGMIHVIVQRFVVFFPFWFFVAIPLLAHTLILIRSALASVCGERFGLRKGAELVDFVRKSWWEIAFASHVFAFSIMAFWALYYRYEVFYPMLITWGLYFSDRAWLLFKAYANPTAILVDEGHSSYVVNQGVGANAEPSHVRLLLKKPKGFSYKAGQWCHIAMPSAGKYWGAPDIVLPFLQWHAFSIASKESDDYLEFNIAALSSGNVLQNDDQVWASKGERANVVQLSRRGKWIDWLCPHRVPYFGSSGSGNKSGKAGSASSRKRVDEMPRKGNFTAENQGLFFNLRGEDGISLKTLKPQMQFTGRLWNTVQWLVEEKASVGSAPEQRVYIMGPYGTLPWTVQAHRAVMLIGAGVGYPSTGAMLRQILEDNLTRPQGEETRVCFMWTASKVNQLLLCFPALLVDLTRYVHAKGLDDLKSWLTVKIFISSFEAGDFLDVNPHKALFSGAEADEMKKPLQTVRTWLLGKDVKKDGGEQIDADGTYMAQGSLGTSFAGILQRSLFTRETVERGDSMGICFCGPPELGTWIRTEVANTNLPVRVEFQAEVAA